MPFKWTNRSDEEILIEQKLQPAHFVWHYFLRSYPANLAKAKCSLCKEVVKYNNNINNLSLHLDRQHFMSTRRLREELQEDRRLENVSYEQDDWVKPPKEETKDRTCIICGVTREREEKIVISKGEVVTQEVSSEKSVPEADKLLSVFKTVCKKIDVPLRCIQPWDFRYEDLPFCKHCAGIATSLYEKQQEIEKLEDQIKGLATNLKDLIWDTKEQFTQSSDANQTILERTVNFRSFVLDNFAREALGDAEEAADEYDQSVHESITIEDDESTNDADADQTAAEENISDEVEIVAEEPADEPKPTPKQTVIRPLEMIPLTRQSPRGRGRPRKKLKENPFKPVDSDEEYVPEFSEKQLKKLQRLEKKKQPEDNANEEPTNLTRCINMGNNKFSYSGHEFQQIVGGEGDVANQGSYICLSCPPGRTYTQKSGVLNHIKTQHLHQTFICFTCGASLGTLTKLKQHEQNHLEGNQRQCICIECEKGFTSTKNLKRHLLDTHRLRLNITCDTCGSLFRTDSELRAHCTDKHSEKSVFCDHCGKGLPDQEKLNEHKAVHVNHKFFKCMHCSACFLQKENAMKHFTEKHNAFFEPLPENDGDGNDSSSANAMEMDSIDELLQ